MEATKIFKSYDFQNNKLLNTKTENPTENEHIVNKQYVDNSQNYSAIENDLILYTNLVTELNEKLPILGNLITVFPLKVTFMFNGNNWEYFNGDYNVVDISQLNSIPNILRSKNKNILLGNTTPIKYIFKNDLTISDEVLTLNQPISSNILENNRYYQLNGILYIAINNDLYKLSEKFYFVENFSFLIGNNQINHNLNSSYISSIIWINNINANINKIFQLDNETNIIDNNRININSEFNTVGNLLITSKF